MTQPAAARKPLMLSLVLLAAALIAAIVVGVIWWGQHTEHSRAAARDAAVDGARQAVVDTQTFNTDDIDGTLARIGAAMTGDIRKNWDQRDRAYTEDRLKERRTTKLRTEPVVVAISPITFDADAHTSDVLVYLVVKSYTDGKLTDDAYRWTYRVTVTEVDGAWKLSAMTPLQEGGLVGSPDPSKAGATAAAPTPGVNAPSSTAPATPAPTEGGTP